MKFAKGNLFKSKVSIGMELNSFILISLFGLIVSSSSNANEGSTQKTPNYKSLDSIILIFDESEILDAHTLNMSINSLPLEVYDCLDTSEKGPDRCSCLDGPPCEYEARFNRTLELYCVTKEKYPEWSNTSPNYILGADLRNYRLGESSTGHALDMTTAEQRFGKACELEKLN